MGYLIYQGKFSQWLSLETCKLAQPQYLGTFVDYFGYTLTSIYIIGYFSRYTPRNSMLTQCLPYDDPNKTRRLRSRKQGLTEALGFSYVAIVQDSSESSQFSRLHLRDRLEISVSTPVSGREGEIWGRLLCTCQESQKSQDRKGWDKRK